MATANSKLKLDFGFDARASSNIDGNLRVEGDFFVNGNITSSLNVTGDLVPTVNGSRLGSAPLRWELLANAGNFSNTLTVTGATSLQDTLAVTKTISGGNTVITGFANISTSVNSALLTVGADFIANTTGAYHTGTVNAASHTIGTTFIANTTGAYHTGTVNAASHTIGTTFIANTTGAYHTGTVNAASFTTAGIVANTTALVPTSNTILLGTSTNRFVISGNTGNFSGALTVSGNTTLTGVVNTSSGLNVNGAIVASNTLAVTGDVTVNSLFTANGNTSFTSGILTVSTNSTLSNTVTVGSANVSIKSGVLFVDSVNNRVGINNTAPGVALRVTGAADISSTANIQSNANVGGTLGVFGNTVLNGAVQTIAGNVLFDTNLLVVDAFNNKVGIGTTTPDATLDIRDNASNLAIGIISTTSNGFFANTSSIKLGNSFVNVAVNTSSVNVATYLSGAITISSNGFLANSSSIVLGNSSVNVVTNTSSVTVPRLYATQGDFSGNVVIQGNLTVSGTTTYINTTNLDVGDNIITLNADLTNLTVPTQSSGIEINRGSSANVSFIWNESTYAWNLGNTNISGALGTGNTTVTGTLTTTGNASLSGTLHTIAGNASFDSGVLFVDTVNDRVGVNKTNPGVALDVTGAANVSTSVNSAAFTVGTSFVVNTSSLAYGTISASSNGLTVNTTAIAFGNTLANLQINTTSVNVATHLSGAIGAASNGFLANSSSIRVGNTSVITIITPSTLSTGDITSNGDITIKDTSPELIFNDSNETISSNTSSIQYNDGRLLFKDYNTGNTKVEFQLGGGNSNTTFGTNSTHKVVISTLQGLITTYGPSGGIIPATNTSGYFLGDLNNRWNLSASDIDASGTISLGTRLYANGSYGTSGQVLVSGGSTNTYWGSASVFSNDLTINQSSPAIYLNDTDNTTITANAMYMQFNAGSYTLVQLNDGDGTTNTRFTFAMTTGNLTVDGEFIAASDERKKDNIVTVDGALGLVDSMRGVYFTRKGSDEKHVGVIAQEMQKVLPEVVSEDADGYLAVSYGNIVGVLIEAIKELKREIEELKNGNQS